ncbi:MAG: sugar nucleotide-binding protein [Eubacteriales bacterium]|nr:sugar nucleotide-binding protein [Eubacteriales bacterium]
MEKTAVKLLITGCGGFLGSRVAAYYQKKYEVWAPSHSELDFADEGQTNKAIAEFCPDVVIHCGAISDVTACSQNPELSMSVNVRGTQYLARACAQSGARFVMCSSDQVYFRDRAAGESEEGFLCPHKETEELFPIPVYGQHKLLAERLALEEQPDSVILRLTWMYGELTQRELQKGRKNLLTILQEAVQNQRPVTFSATDYRGVTDVKEVVRNLEAAWKLPAGVYNFGSSNDACMYETVRHVMTAAGCENLVQKEEGSALRNLTMDIGKLENCGIGFSGTAERILRYVLRI